MKILKSYALSLALSCVAVAEDKAQDQFAKFASGNFEPLNQFEVSGWMMKSEDGEEYHRAVLNAQVAIIERIGFDSVQAAIQNLKHPQMYMRYIAAESLRRITKQDPTWYSFGTPGETFNGNKTWSEDATKVWQDWYESKKEA